MPSLASRSNFTAAKMLGHEYWKPCKQPGYLSKHIQKAQDVVEREDLLDELHRHARLVQNLLV